MVKHCKIKPTQKTPAKLSTLVQFCADNPCDLEAQIEQGIEFRLCS